MSVSGSGSGGNWVREGEGGVSKSGRNVKFDFGRGFGLGLEGGCLVNGKVGLLEGTGANSNSPALTGVGGEDLDTELQGRLSSYKGRRAMGTFLRYWEGWRRARGSGSWGAVGRERWIAFSSRTSL